MNKPLERLSSFIWGLALGVVAAIICVAFFPGLFITPETITELVEVPVEVIREIEVVKEVEVIKEIEVVKEVDVVVEMPNSCGVFFLKNAIEISEPRPACLEYKGVDILIYDPSNPENAIIYESTSNFLN